MQTYRFASLLALLCLACDPINPCPEGRYDPGPPRACVLDDGGRVPLDDAGPVDAARPDTGPIADGGGCVVRVETCDGTDEDCDGNFDETFDCARGGVTECTTSCGSTGTGTCSSTCTLPSAAECTPPAETCNGVDDDCDGVADDGVLEWGTPIEWATNVADVAVEPLDEGYVLVWRTAPSGLAARRFGADGRPLGAAVQLETRATGALAVAANGDRLLVVFAVDGSGAGDGTFLVEAALDTLVPAPAVLVTATTRTQYAIIDNLGILIAVGDGGTLQAFRSTTTAGPFRTVDIMPPGYSSLGWGLVRSRYTAARSFLTFVAIPAGETDTEVFVQRLSGSTRDGELFRVTTDDLEQRYPRAALRRDEALLVSWADLSDRDSLVGPARSAVVTLAPAPSAWRTGPVLADDARVSLPALGPSAAPLAEGWLTVLAFPPFDAPSSDVSLLSAAPARLASHGLPSAAPDVRLPVGVVASAVLVGVIAATGAPPDGPARIELIPLVCPAE